MNLNLTILFKKIYSWIKYKTLPTSFLFKNRLFIERNSKHNRIFSNFGLNFRHTKWTDFNLYNIQNKFYTNYKNFLIFLIILAYISYILISFFFNYDYYYAFNEFSFFLWVFVDSIEYYILFTIWSISIISSLLINFFFYFFFFNNFSDISHDEWFFKKNLINLKTNNLGLSNFSFKDQKWIFQLWIWKSNENFSIYNKALSSFFNDSSKTSNLGNYFFYELFSVIFFLNSTNFNNNFINLQKKNTNDFVKNIKTSFCLNLDYFLLYLPFMNQKNSSFFLKNIKIYNLSLIENKIDTNLKTNSKFYLNNWNFSFLPSQTTSYLEFFKLQPFIGINFQSYQWNRWLYRYSLLHRKVLRNSYKVTSLKRLFSTNSISPTLSKSNIWFSTQLAQIKNINFFKNQYNFLIYSDYLFFFGRKTNNLNSKNQIVDNLNSFNENSFFWSNKRFFFFNNLVSNKINSSFYKNFNLSDLVEKNQKIKIDFIFNTDQLNKNFEIINRNYLVADYFWIKYGNDENKKVNEFDQIFFKDLYYFKNNANFLSKTSFELILRYLNSQSFILSKFYTKNTPRFFLKKNTKFSPKFFKFNNLTGIQKLTIILNQKNFDDLKFLWKI